MNDGPGVLLTSGPAGNRRGSASLPTLRSQEPGEAMPPRPGDRIIPCGAWSGAHTPRIPFREVGRAGGGWHPGPVVPPPWPSGDPSPTPSGGPAAYAVAPSGLGSTNAMNRRGHPLCVTSAVDAVRPAVHIYFIIQSTLLSQVKNKKKSSRSPRRSSRPRYPFNIPSRNSLRRWTCRLARLSLDGEAFDDQPPQCRRALAAGS